MLLVIIGFVLRLLENTRNLSRNFLEFVFRLIPFFSFNFGVLNLSNLNLYKLIFLWGDLPDPFEPKAVLWDFLFLIFVGIICIIGIVVVENSFKFSGKFKALN